MPTLPPSDAGSIAGSLFTQLTAGREFSLPAADLSGEEFQIPPLDEVNVQTLDEAALTSRTVAGTGLFDGLMESIRAHLEGEFQKNRITGAQYTEAFISMTGTAMGAAVQYLLTKDQAQYQAALMQRQAQIAEIGVVTARIGAEESKARLQMVQIQAQNAEVEFALNKLRLASEDMNWRLMDQQRLQAEFQTTEILPLQRSGLLLDQEMRTVEIARVTYELEELLPLQKDITQSELELKASQVSKIEFEVGQMMPAQLVGMTKDNEVKDAQIEGMGTDNQVKRGQLDRITFEVAEILPATLIGMEADNALKGAQVTKLESDITMTEAQISKITYELTEFMPVQLAGMTKDNEVKDAQIDSLVLDGTVKTATVARMGYELSNILPAQLADIEAGTGAKIAQRDQTLFETSSILPAQRRKLDAEEAVVQYQLEALYPAQVEGISADTAGKAFNNEFLLPAQLDSLREQTEGHRAKTMDTRTDGTTVGGGMGAQKRLYEQQILSFQRDAESKAVKMMMDTWTVQRSTDADLAAPSQLNNSRIDSAVQKLRANLDL